MRNTVFGAWLRDPNVNNPRRLAVQYGISIKRVEAIIRLKSHQNSLGKVCHCSDAPRSYGSSVMNVIRLVLKTSTWLKNHAWLSDTFLACFTVMQSTD